MVAFLASIPCELRAEVTATDLSALDYAVYIPKASVSAGSRADVTICLKNVEAIATWQADLEMPDGFIIATNSFNDPMVVVSGSRTSTSRHSIAINTLENGDVRLLYNSASNYTIQGTDGEIATLTLNIDEGVEAGDYAFTFKNIVLSEANETGHKVDAVTSILTVGDDTPVYDEGYAVEIAPFTLTEDRDDIAICLSNATPLTNVEFDMALPKAFLDIEGYGISLGTSTSSTKKYACSVEDNEDGTVYVTCSRKSTNILAEDCGNILNLELWFEDEDRQPINKSGVYELTLKNIVLTDAEGEEYHAAPYTTSFFVGDMSTLKEVPAFTGNFDEDGVAAFNEAFAENTAVTSFDFSGATVSGDEALSTANKNAVFFLVEGSSVNNESNVVIGDVCGNLVLTDGFAFGPAKAFTVTKGEYSRTLSADTYGTIVLPFAPDAETLKGYTFYELTGVETDALTFDEVANPVAGKPYIVTSDGAATKMTAEAESVVVIEPAATEADGWTMTGTYDSVVFTDADELANLYCISGNQFKQATSKLTMNPFRAYFVGGGSAKSIELRSDDGSTRIINLIEDVENGQLYDIQGRKVVIPAQGIYIQNGKKVLVK